MRRSLGFPAVERGDDQRRTAVLADKAGRERRVLPHRQNRLLHIGKGVEFGDDRLADRGGPLVLLHVGAGRRVEFDDDLQAPALEGVVDLLRRLRRLAVRIGISARQQVLRCRRSVDSTEHEEQERQCENTFGRRYGHTGKSCQHASPLARRGHLPALSYRQ